MIEPGSPRDGVEALKAALALAADEADPRAARQRVLNQAPADVITGSGDVALMVEACAAVGRLPADAGARRYAALLSDEFVNAVSAVGDAATVSGLMRCAMRAGPDEAVKAAALARTMTAGQVAFALDSGHPVCIDAVAKAATHMAPVACLRVARQVADHERARQAVADGLHPACIGSTLGLFTWLPPAEQGAAMAPLLEERCIAAWTTSPSPDPKTAIHVARAIEDLPSGRRSLMASKFWTAPVVGALAGCGRPHMIGAAVDLAMRTLESDAERRARVLSGLMTEQAVDGVSTQGDGTALAQLREGARLLADPLRFRDVHAGMLSTLAAQRAAASGDARRIATLARVALDHLPIGAGGHWLSHLLTAPAVGAVLDADQVADWCTVASAARLLPDVAVRRERLRTIAGSRDLDTGESDLERVGDSGLVVPFAEMVGAMAHLPHDEAAVALQQLMRMPSVQAVAAAPGPEGLWATGRAAAALPWLEPGAQRRELAQRLWSGDSLARFAAEGNPRRVARAAASVLNELGDHPDALAELLPGLLTPEVCRAVAAAAAAARSVPRTQVTDLGVVAQGAARTGLAHRPALSDILVTPETVAAVVHLGDGHVVRAMADLAASLPEPRRAAALNALSTQNPATPTRHWRDVDGAAPPAQRRSPSPSPSHGP